MRKKIEERGDFLRRDEGWLGTGTLGFGVCALRHWTPSPATEGGEEVGMEGKRLPVRRTSGQAFRTVALGVDPLD